MARRTLRWLPVVVLGALAVAGAVAAVGGRADVASWCRRRFARADDDERGWLQTVVGALAADVE